MDVRPHIFLRRLIAALIAGIFCVAASESHAADKKNGLETDYEQWISRYAQTNRTALFFPSEKAAPLKLIVTTVGEEHKTNNVRTLSRFGSGVATHGSEISSEGKIAYFSTSDFGSKGGSGPNLGILEVARLDVLLAKLPSDGSQLPPSGRRMILQANVSGHWVTRVYDRANAADVVWEILQLCHCGIGSWLPSFKPESEIDARGDESGGFLCLTPDGRTILFARDNGPVQLWDATTHEFLREIPTPGDAWNSIRFSPDGSFAVIGGSECVVLDSRTWKVVKTLKARRSNGGFYTLTFPQFTPDGHHLLLQNNKPSLEIYDTRTWQSIERLPEVLADALQYFASPNGKRALIRLNSGQVVLWDITHRQRQLAVLDTNVDLTQVSFSPDNSLVAAATAQSTGDRYLGYWGPPKLRIWKTANGKPVHELHPYELGTYEGTEGLLWTPDGHYVLAATKPNGFVSARGLNVFNVKTGRHRGDFSGCPTTMVGMALLPGGNQVIAGCEDGRIRFWNVADALKQIKAFEASLPPLRH
jgi:WD40 repeat protein